MNQTSFKDLTTLNIGGPVKDVINVVSEEELISALKSLIINHQSFLIIGGGSNLLVSDSGYNGTVIKNEIRGIYREGNNLTVKSGTSLQDLVDFTNDQGLKGLESLAGIPGTVGGAIYGNAGAYGQTISDHLVSVTILNCHAELVSASSKSQNLSQAWKILKQVQDDKVTTNNETIQQFNNNDCHFSYRSSIFKKTKDILLEAVFALSPGNSKDLKKISSNTIVKREVKYPPGIKCPGSFFKNIIAANLPQEILDKIPKEKIVYGKVPAGTLLEEVGAKGDKRGNIQIAPYHANLFINLGEGTAEDFYNLAKKYFEKVKEKYGITLESEVQLINLPPLA